MKIDRSKWKPCKYCEPKCTTCINMGAWDRYGKPYVCETCENNSNYNPDDNYCSECGRPLTERAWRELERRINYANQKLLPKNGVGINECVEMTGRKNNYEEHEH